MSTPDKFPVPSPIEEIEELEDEDLDGESVMEDEFPEGDFRVIADALVTNDGEAIADVLNGIREALEKTNRILYKMATAKG